MWRQELDLMTPSWVPSNPGYRCGSGSECLSPAGGRLSPAVISPYFAPPIVPLVQSRQLLEP